MKPLLIRESACLKEALFMGAEVLTVKISSVQAVALAFVTYFIGLWIKNRVPVFQNSAYRLR